MVMHLWLGRCSFHRSVCSPYRRRCLRPVNCPVQIFRTATSLQSENRDESGQRPPQQHMKPPSTAPQPVEKKRERLYSQDMLRHRTSVTEGMRNMHEIREAVWGPNATDTSHLMQPEAVFVRLCADAKDDHRIADGVGDKSCRSRRSVPSLLTCPNCSLKCIGQRGQTVHLCPQSGQQLRTKDMSPHPLLYPGDLYYNETIKFERTLPPGIQAANAFECLPNFKWPDFVRDFLEEEYSAREQLGQIFCSSAKSSPTWLATQAVDRLLSLPRFSVLADRFHHAFHMTARSCQIAASHFGSGSRWAMWYSECARQAGPRCAYLGLRGVNKTHRYRHWEVAHAYVAYPCDLSARFSTPSAVESEVPFSVPLDLVARERKHSGRRLNNIYSIWDLPVAIRRRLVYATVAEKDALHPYVSKVGLRGLVEWRGVGVQD